MDENELTYLLDCICYDSNVNSKVIAADEFHTVRYDRLPLYLIVNVSKRNEESNVGHWYVLNAYRARNNGIIFDYWDPLGYEPSDYNLSIPFHVRVVSRRAIQLESSDSCGKYCLAYILARLKGLQPLEIAECLFSVNNKVENERRVEKFVRQIFRQCQKKTSLVKLPLVSSKGYTVIQTCVNICT